MVVETFTVGDARSRVLILGEGSPLLYLHGFERHPGEASFLSRFAANYRVYAPEYPGWGDSTGLESIHDVLDQVMFLRQLVEQFGVGPVDIVGHCLGGMFAAELAALCPALVRKVVLVGAYGLWLDDHQVPDAFVMSDKELKAAKWHNVELAPASEPSFGSDTSADAGTAALGRAGNLGSATKFMWPIPERGLHKRLHLIKAPTLVVHGASDGLVPPVYAEEFGRRIPSATVSIMAAAGHVPMLECEDAFVDSVNSFLSA
jgi:pimeloyl-ACP methyl ester carboxylesterase